MTWLCAQNSDKWKHLRQSDFWELGGQDGGCLKQREGEGTVGGMNSMSKEGVQSEM